MRKSYPGTPRVEVIHGVDLAINQGELLAIVGPSGSGKSTLLHIMGTLDRPTSGQVVVNGTDVTTLRDREVAAVRAHDIGFVFQQFFLLPGLSTLDNVANGLLYSGLKRSKRRLLALEALSRVGLQHRVKHKPSAISGGEMQRVAIARALIGFPAIILADEPTGNLDSVNSAAIVDLLRQLHAQGATIAVITHDSYLARQMPRVVFIDDGVITGDSRNGHEAAIGLR